MFLLNITIVLVFGGAFFIIFNSYKKIVKKNLDLEMEISGLKKRIKKLEVISVKKQTSQTVQSQSGVEVVLKNILDKLNLSKNLIKEIIIIEDQPTIFNCEAEDDEGLAVIVDEARELIKSTGVAAKTILMKRLTLTGDEAELVLNLLEEEGIVGPSDGSSHRSVLIRE